MTKNTLLVDADVIYYQFAFRNQEDVDWDGDGEITSMTFLDKALVDVEDFIEKLKEDLCGDQVVLVESSRINFRKLLWPEYKSNRKGTTKPELFFSLKDWVLNGDHGYTVRSQEGLEGDDVLGILATSSEYPNPIVVTIDKDLATVPCRLYLWNKHEDGVNTISPEEGYRNFVYQVLVGDPADGYKGCPGVGKVKATKLLDTTDDPEDLWDKVVELYESKGLTEDDAILQARMAYILRCWDYVDGVIRLWHPHEVIFKSIKELQDDPA